MLLVPGTAFWNLSLVRLRKTLPLLKHREKHKEIIVHIVKEGHTRCIWCTRLIWNKWVFWNAAPAVFHTGPIEPLFFWLKFIWQCEHKSHKILFCFSSLSLPCSVLFILRKFSSFVRWHTVNSWITGPVDADVLRIICFGMWEEMVVPGGNLRQAWGKHQGLK